MSYPGTENNPYDSHEQAGLVDYSERLRNLLHVDENIATELRPVLWDKVGKLASSLIDPSRQQAIELYGGIIDWQLLGQPGDPLPQGLQLMQHEGRLAIAHDVSIPHFTQRLPTIINRELTELGIKEISTPIQRELYKNKTELDAILTSFLHQSAEFQLLSSFSRPEPRLQPRTLNEYWRQVRHSQAESTVRDLYSYDSADQIVAGSPASYALRRYAYHIEEETRLAPSPSADGLDGLRKARQYLLPYLYEASSPNSATDKLLTPPKVYFDDESGGESILTYETQAGRVETAVSSIQEQAAYILSNKLYSGPLDMKFICELFSDVAIEKIFDNHTYSIEEALTTAFGVTISEIYDYIDRSIHFNSPVEYPGMLNVLSRAPTASTVLHGKPPEPTTYDVDWVDIFNSSVSYNTYQKLSNGFYAVEGRVIEYAPDNFRVAARIILKALSHAPEQEVEHEDLVIELKGLDEGIEPIIPGFKLTTKTAPDRYGFVIDESGDPYSPCEVSIDGRQRSMLIEEYHAIGLHTLARSLESQSNLTVDSFVQLIKNHSTYYVPNLDGGDDVTNPVLNTRFKHTLADFSSSIHNDRLLAQCTTSNSFLRLSLNRIFGPGSTGEVSGLTIKSDDTIIRGNSHIQTVFTIDGMRYILDATPPYTLGYTAGIPPAQRSVVERQAATAPKISHRSQPKDSKADVEMPVKPAEELLAELKVSFCEQAKVIFQLPNDRMLGEFLVKLPAQDPARRTFELLSQYSSGRIDVNQLTEQAKYVTKCPSLPRNIRQMLKIDHYSLNFLEQLRLTVERLRAISES